jgi:hypothetical protein
MKTNRIDAFAAKYLPIAKAAAEGDDVVYLKLEVHELTAHEAVNRLLIQALRHASNGEVQHFEALVQDARNEFAKIKEASLKAMRDR